MRRAKLSIRHGITRTHGRGRVIAIEDGSIVWLSVLDRRGEVIGRIKFDARRVKLPTLPAIGSIVNYTETGDTVTHADLS
jgi:hypothetical protein